MVSTQSMKGEFIKSIKNEMYLLKKISHENIVKYIDFIQTEFHYSIILELIESGSLYGIIKKFGPFQESLAVIFIKQVTNQPTNLTDLLSSINSLYFPSAIIPFLVKSFLSTNLSINAPLFRGCLLLSCPNNTTSCDNNIDTARIGILASTRYRASRYQGSEHSDNV